MTCTTIDAMTEVCVGEALTPRTPGIALSVIIGATFVVVGLIVIAWLANRR